jgi:hypothetical protein
MVLLPTNKRANPAAVIQVWYDPPDLEVPAVTTRSWRNKGTGGGSVFNIVRSNQTVEAGVDGTTQAEPVLNEVKPAEESGLAYNAVRPYPDGPRYHPWKWDGRGKWGKCNGHWWRPATDPKIKSIQEIARKKNKYNRDKQQCLQTVNVQIKKTDAYLWQMMNPCPRCCSPGDRVPGNCYSSQTPARRDAYSELRPRQKFASPLLHGRMREKGSSAPTRQL